MSITAKMRGHDIKEWYIKGNDNPLNFIELQSLIINRSVTEETMIFRPSKTPLFSNKKCKKAIEHSELQNVLINFLLLEIIKRNSVKANRITSLCFLC